MKNQLKAGVVLSYISTAFTIIIQLVYMPIMIRLLGQSEYGLYSLVSGVVSYLSLFSLGFSGAYIRFFARCLGNEKKIASLNGMFLILFSVLAGIATICGIVLSFFPRQIFGSMLSLAELSKARILMLILVINIAISLISSIFDSIICAYEKFVFHRIVALLSTVISPFVTLPLLLMGFRSVMLVTVTTIVTLVRLAVYVWYCVRKIKIPVSFNGFEWRLLKEIAIFSSFLFINMIIDQINWNVDKLILGHTNGTNEVAVYGVAGQINSLFQVFSVTISSVFIPRVNHIAVQRQSSYSTEFTKLMAKIGRIQWMILGLPALGFIIFGKYFIVNIYAGKGYENAYTASLFLILPALIPLIQNVGIEIQRALNKHQFRAVIYLIMAILNVFISIPLAKSFGAVGAAAGTAVSLIVGNGLIMNIFYHKALKIDMKYFWKEIFITFKGLIIPVLTAILIIKRVTFNSMAVFFISILAFIAVYLISVVAFSLNKEEKNMLLSLNRKNKKMAEKRECCGCTACVHICPEKCIEMKEDEEGFLYPSVDKEKCINCLKCENVCPVKDFKAENVRTVTYIGYSKNEDVRIKSSSGGIFSLVAERILSQNGVVFGAAFDENFEVLHIGVQTEEELSKLRGSKYVQSRLSDTFVLVKEYLENDRKVLFTGTACQIAGLKNYLNKDYENLYTIDVLCHGVPSPRVWKMYLENRKSKYSPSIENIEFRNKKTGWKTSSFKMDFSDNQEYCAKIYEDKYMQMFLGNIDLRPSCYDCRFKDIPRMSDMTIGDSWGVENFMPDMDDDMGTSAILTHSQKGRELFEEIRENLNVRELSTDKPLPSIEESKKSVLMHPNREKFFKGLKNGESFDDLCRYNKKNLIQKGFSFIRYILEKSGLK